MVAICAATLLHGPMTSSRRDRVEKGPPPARRRRTISAFAHAPPTSVRAGRASQSRAYSARVWHPLEASCCVRLPSEVARCSHVLPLSCRLGFSRLGAQVLNTGWVTRSCQCPPWAQRRPSRGRRPCIHAYDRPVHAAWRPTRRT